MIVFLGKNNQEVNFTIEDDDIPKTYHIMEMMKTEGWRQYQNYMTQIRNEFIEMGKEGIMKRTTREMSENKWAIIYGYDTANRFIQAVLEGVDRLIKLKSKQEENTNDEQ